MIVSSAELAQRMVKSKSEFLFIFYVFEIETMRYIIFKPHVHIIITNFKCGAKRIPNTDKCYL